MTSGGSPLAKLDGGGSKDLGLALPQAIGSGTPGLSGRLQPFCSGMSRSLPWWVLRGRGSLTH